MNLKNVNDFRFYLILNAYSSSRMTIITLGLCVLPKGIMRGNGIMFVCMVSELVA